MQHLIVAVTAVRVVGPSRLWLRFDDATEREINLSTVLAGELYGPLQDPDLFAQVAIDPDAGTVTWPNGADFDPAILHDWPDHSEAFEARARAWEAARA